jgi:hypothetical protein
MRQRKIADFLKKFFGRAMLPDDLCSFFEESSASP